MDPSVFGSPYRPPCGGWPAKEVVGPVMHYRLGDKTDYWKNTTQVAKHDGSAGTEKPQPRTDDELDWPSATQPGSNCPCDPGTGCAQLTPHGAPYTGPWTMAEFPTCPAGAGLATFDGNCYAKQTAQLDYGVWRKLGFKVVQGLRWWHGMYRLLSHDPSGRISRRAVTFANQPASGDTNWIDYSGETSTCAYSTEDEQPTPDRAKYCAVSVTAEKKHTDSYGGEANDYDEPITVSASVNPLSGVIKATIPTDTPHGARAAVKVYRPQDADNMYTAGTANISYHGGSESNPNAVSEVSSDGIFWTWTLQEWRFDPTAGDLIFRTTFTQTLNEATGEYHSIQYGYDVTGLVWDKRVTIDLTISDAAFSFASWAYSTSGVEVFQDWTTVTGTLGTTNSASTVYADMKSIMALWPLNDDKLYPWRIDSYVTSGPLVGRSEVQGPVSPETALTMPPGWMDPADPDNPDAAPENMCYGTVTGAPLSYYAAGGSTIGGYGPHFDWRHKTWWGCVDGGENPVSYVALYGAWSGAQPGHAADRIACGDPTDDNQPPGATRWLENHPWPGRVPMGAWVSSAMPFKQWTGGYDGQWVTVNLPGMFMAQKWAEIKIPRPSHNYFRPCGLDRYELDTANVHCVSSSTGTPLVVTLRASASFTAGDHVVYADAAGGAGLYTIASGSGATWTLSAQIRVLPASVDYPMSTLSKLRWYSTAWPIPGRIAVASATDSGAGEIDLVLAAPAVALQTGDAVDFTGLPFSGAATNLSVTVVDQTHCHVPGAFTGAYTSGGYVSSHGAPNFKWNDGNAKGDYLVIAWQQNQRDYQERARAIKQWSDYADCHWGSAPGSPIRANQRTHGMPSAVTAFEVIEDCLPFSGCCPQVICISPNGETWANGTTYWPDDGAISANIGDDRYGYVWQGLVQQDIGDPLWVQPAAPCGTPGGAGCAWLEDQDGLCLTDVCDDSVGGAGGKRYFAHRPMVEPRNSLPTIGGDTAPALPSGCYVGYLSLAALDTTSPVNGFVLPPPQVAEDANGTLRLEGFGFDASNAGVLWPGTPITPWEVWLHEANCVCLNTRPDFAPQYTLDAVPRCIGS